MYGQTNTGHDNKIFANSILATHVSRPTV